MITERGARKRERESNTQKITQEKLLSKTIDQKKGQGLIISSSYKQQSSKSDVLEVGSIARVDLVGITVLLWGRRKEATEWAAWLGDPLR